MIIYYFKFLKETVHMRWDLRDLNKYVQAMFCDLWQSQKPVLQVRNSKGALYLEVIMGKENGPK